MRCPSIDGRSIAAGRATTGAVRRLSCFWLRPGRTTGPQTHSLVVETWICAFCLTKNDSVAIYCRVCGFTRNAVPSLLYLRAGFDVSLLLSGELAVGNVAFDVAHRGGDSLLFLTSHPEETLEKAAALGSTVGKTILLKPSALPRAELQAAGGVREWLLSDKSATRRAHWQQTTRSIADGLREPAGTFLSRDAVKSLHAESDIIAKTKSGGVTLYELRVPEEPRRTLITVDADKLNAAVSKVLQEKRPGAPQPQDEPEER